MIAQHERYANFTPTEQRDYRESQKEMWDLFAITTTAEEKGRMKEKYAMAKRMKDDQMPIDVISKYSGLTKEEIEQL